MYQSGMYDFTKKKELRIEAPPGLIISRPVIEKQKVISASFLNVPSFVLHDDITLKISGKEVKLYIAFGGAFYAIVEADNWGLHIDPPNIPSFIALNDVIKSSIIEKFPIIHPFEKELGFLYGTIFISPPKMQENHSRNICIFADGEVDRSPTGSGVSARGAVLHSKGQLPLEKIITIESVIGTEMQMELKEITTFGPYYAVIPEVTGSAWITGINTFYIDPEDPLKEGFLLK